MTDPTTLIDDHATAFARQAVPSHTTVYADGEVACPAGSPHEVYPGYWHAKGSTHMLLREDGVWHAYVWDKEKDARLEDDCWVEVPLP